MTQLLDMHCKRPKAEEKLSDQEIQAYAAQVPDWEVFTQDGIPRIRRAFKFKNFSQALAFTVRVGILAEKEDHHPALTTEWGKVTVEFWTHAVDGLHLNDFIAAAKTDAL